MPSPASSSSKPSARSGTVVPMGAERCDVVVLGASYGGLVTAALLAQGGKRVVVVDPMHRVGVPGGAWPYEGYWIPWGHRDGLGMRQSSFTTSHWNLDVAERLGIDLPLAGPNDPTMHCHVLPGGAVVAMPLDGSGFPDLARHAFG